MSRLVAVLATLACMIGLTVAPAPPAAADSVTAGASDWSVALTFPDMQWSSEGCQFLPVTAVVTGATVQSWTFGGFVSGPEDEGDEPTWYIDYDTKVTDGVGTFSFRHAVMLCPGYDSASTYDVVGEVGALLAGAAAWAWVPYRATFTVTGIPTTTTLDSITLDGPEAAFVGRTVPVPPVPAMFRHCMNAGVQIEGEANGDWESVGYGELRDDGSFVAMVPTYQLTRTQYRARLSGGAICAASTSGVQALPVMLPAVRISTVAKESKLKVDIDPNRGRKAWAFQVQRRSDDDSWRTLRTYRTRGSHETRVINLPKGVYRVHVLARFGFAETYSDTIYLQR
jgi:hypothetical protein